MNGKSYFLAALALCGLGTMSGCASGTLEAWTYPSMVDVKRLAELETKERSTHAEARSKEHQAMSPEAAEEIARIKADSDAKIAKIIEEREKYRGTVAKAFEKVGKDGLAMALEMAGIPSIVTDKLRPEIEDAQDAASEAEIAATLVGAKVEDAVEDLDEIQMALAALSKETRAKFASTTKETFDKLSALRADDAEFRRVLQQDLQLTSAEMEALKGMSTEQILALLAAAGGAAGIGVAGGRGGKSRAQPEIEKLKESISGIAASIERMKPPVT